MSKFGTFIPVDIDAVLKELPPGAQVHSVDLIEKQVYIVWEHQDLVSPFTFPLEYPFAQLKARKLPERVKATGKLSGPVENAPETPKSETPKKRR